MNIFHESRTHCQCHVQNQVIFFKHLISNMQTLYFNLLTETSFINRGQLVSTIRWPRKLIQIFAQVACILCSLLSSTVVTALKVSKTTNAFLELWLELLRFYCTIQNAQWTQVKCSEFSIQFHMPGFTCLKIHDGNIHPFYLQPI